MKKTMSSAQAQKSLEQVQEKLLTEYYAVDAEIRTMCTAVRHAKESSRPKYTALILVSTLTLSFLLIALLNTIVGLLVLGAGILYVVNQKNTAKYIYEKDSKALEREISTLLNSLHSNSLIDKE